jgi:hypothetical protein
MHEVHLLLDWVLGYMTLGCILAMWDNPNLNQLVEPHRQLKLGPPEEREEVRRSPV